MKNRADMHADFARRFARDGLNGPATPCAPSDLDRIEAELDCSLPLAYRYFLTSFGPLFVPPVWDAIVELELNVHPLREFLNPTEVVQATRSYWAAGMPNDLIGIAGDFMGNLFGFIRVAKTNILPDDLPVVLFDHDYVCVTPVADSFDDWIAWFVSHLPTA